MMSQQYPNGQTHPAYGHRDVQAAGSLSGPPSNGISQQTSTSAQTLPPLSTANYGPGNSMQDYEHIRPQAMMPMHYSQGNPSQHQYEQRYVPIYAPTSNTFVKVQDYNNNYGTYAHASQHQQQTETSRPPSTHIPSQSLSQPSHNITRSLPEIAPMPPRVRGGPTVAYGDGNSDSHSDEQTSPSHVVGAQGRRGILPSTIGRPAAVVGADLSGTKSAPLPPRGDDGKYPCPHCEKTYLHSKHLKRHLLRHTGVRPYSCGLCTDTFSRSDILKRHFHKCSSRRGNPTGQNHLAHSRANKKYREEHNAVSIDSCTPTIPDLPSHPSIPIYTPTSSEASVDMKNFNLHHQDYNEHSNRVSRANSVTRSKRSTGSQSNRTSFGLANPPGYEATGYGHSAGHVTPDSITTSGAATPYTFQHEPRNHQLPGHEQFSHTPNGEFTYGASSRPPTSSNYSHASLPLIVGHGNTRGYNNEWPPYQPYNPHDDYGNVQYHSGTNTPLEREKVNDDVPLFFPKHQPHLDPSA